jgi:hypothetical protein
MRRDLSEQPLPGRRQTDPPGTTVEEPLAEQLFQPSHLVAERAHREVQRRRGTREVPQTRGGDEAR